MARERIKLPPKKERERIRLPAKPERQEEPVARSAAVKQCAFCKHWYISPCDEKKAKQCANYKFLQQSKRRA